MKNLGMVLGLAGISLGALFGCDEIPGQRLVIPIDGVAGGLDPSLLVDGVGVGADCSTESCRSGLSCIKDVCEPAMSKEVGEACLIGPECEAGLTCFVGPCSIPGLAQCPICQDAGQGEAGDSCELDLYCEAGLRCSLNGFSAECARAGTSDLGETCTLQNDCFQGLYCSEGKCALPEPPLGVPLWQGAECPEADDDDVEALFFVPGAEGTPKGEDFFQLPFPNDIRLGDDGRPDLTGFPTPGSGLVGVDMVKAYVDALETKGNGWGTNPTVIFRFSGPLDFGSISPPMGERPLQVVDLTDLPAGSAEEPTSFSISFSAGGRTNYVCNDWLAIRLPRDTLKPNHTYAAWIGTDARSTKGAAIKRSPQFDAMLDSRAPSGDAALAKAYDAYEPLRDFLSFYEGSPHEVDADEILNAVVFTTDDPTAQMRKLASAVEAADAPQASEWVKCGGSATSPCAQADEEEGRACGEGTDDYDEYQALLSIPIFQEGEAPYLKSGGSIASAQVRSEKICMSMSIPKSVAPAGGWPLVIYGHGTGGSYRGSLRDSVAGRLAREAMPMATLGFDQVQHGPRRGTGEGSDQDPDNLFFNFLNPDAAQGNPLQGAADVLSVLRFASGGALATAAETGDVAIDVDPTKLFLFGHSQGSTHGSIALPFSTLPGGVLSGNGGGLAEALLNKTNPVNIAGAIPLVIQDADGEGNLRMGDKHPVLSLLQQFIDSADPVNFAALLGQRPEAGMAPKSVLQTFGLDDTYSPPATLARFIYAAEVMTLAAPPNGVNAQGANELRMTPADMPVSGNVTIGADTATLVCRQYNAKSGSDGHFVVHDVKEANDDAIGFLSSLVAGTQPQVPVAP